VAIGKTKLDELLQRGKLLKELDAWNSSFNEMTKKQLIEWVQDQLQQGKDGNDVLQGTYSYATQLISKGRKQQGDNYTFEDTGYFYNSMQVYISEYLIEITGDGKKGNENLYTKYSQFLTTLNDEHIEKLKTIINKTYIDYIRKILRID
jgi:hypothetical protein